MRIDRRAFLSDIAGAAGLVFAGCCAAAAGQPTGVRGGSRRAVTVAGRRVTTIDMHAHCAVPAAIDLLRAPASAQTQAGLLALDGDPLAARLAAMDAQGIDRAVLSINPTWYGAERALAERVIAIQNEAMAAFCAAHADRFSALASVALQFPDLAARQLQEATTKLGLPGVAIGGSVGGAELADPKFHPFWAAAEQLDALVFIHPQATGSAALADRLKGNGLLGNVIGNPLETTVALSHLIFEGTLDRFARLKICAAHGGGYLPSYMARSDHGCRTFPAQCTSGVPRRPPTEYVKQLYYDSLVFTPEALRHLAAEVGADHIVMGTDYPYPWVDAPVDHVLATEGLTDGHREAILGGTAARLLRLSSR